MDYLRALTLEDSAQQMILEELLMQIESLLEKIERYNEMIETQVESWRWKPVVDALQAMRGIKLLTATVPVAELGDLRRFDCARKRMSFLGLVSADYSSADKPSCFSSQFRLL